MKWKIIDSGKKSAQANMELDARLLNQLSVDDAPLLHLYDWEGQAGTYGHFLKPERFLNIEKAKKWNLSLARRPTGGGIVFHVSDLAFSVLVPAGCSHFSHNTLSNYHFINHLVKKALQKFFELEGDPSLLEEDPEPLDAHSKVFCMAKPTIYDVMMGSQKVAGAAQRRRKQGFLHQGSIAIALPETTFLKEVLLQEPRC